MKQIEARLREIIENMGLDYKPDATWDEVGADSLDLIELVMACEEEFGVEVSDDDAESLLTAAEVVKYLESHC